MIIRFFFFFCFFQLSALESIHYPLTDEPIDVVIPCHEKDKEVLKLCLKGIQENCVNLGKIFIVSDTQFTDEAEWFDETQYPFSKEDIGKRLCKIDFIGSHLSKHRVICWIYQQLLKFYAPFVIPDLSSNVLILDADTIFINPVNFLNEKLGANFNITVQEKVNKGQTSYFKHMKKLVGIIPYHPLYDPVCHHMLFQKPILEDLFETAETTHREPFWVAFCDCFDWKTPRVSEYWIYFSFAMSRSDQLSFCELKWENHGDISKLEEYKDEGYHFVSYHHHHRKESHQM